MKKNKERNPVTLNQFAAILSKAIDDSKKSWEKSIRLGLEILGITMFAEMEANMPEKKKEIKELKDRFLKESLTMIEVGKELKKIKNK